MASPQLTTFHELAEIHGVPVPFIHSLCRIYQWPVVMDGETPCVETASLDAFATRFAPNITQRAHEIRELLSETI